MTCWAPFDEPADADWQYTVWSGDRTICDTADRRMADDLAAFETRRTGERVRVWATRIGR